MLVQVIGFTNFEKIERKVDPVMLEKLKSSLGALKSVRNPEAHTHVKGTRRIDAPSVTKSHFKNVYNGLVEFDLALKKIKKL